jgi:5'-3' exonuclease
LLEEQLDQHHATQRREEADCLVLCCLRRVEVPRVVASCETHKRTALEVNAKHHVDVEIYLDYALLQLLNPRGVSYLCDELNLQNRDQ